MATTIGPVSRFDELKTRRNQIEIFSEKPRTGSELISGGFFVYNKCTTIVTSTGMVESPDAEYVEEIQN